MPVAANAPAIYEAAETVEFNFGDLANKYINGGLTVGAKPAQYDLHVVVEDGRVRVSMTHDDALTGQRTLVAGDPLDGAHEPARHPVPRPGIVPAWPDIGKGPVTLRLGPAF
jgi:hypothetical protein